MQIVQNNNTLFATIFVYDQQGFPFWYTATLFATAVNPTNGAPSFAGDLYETRGPFFGAIPFNPAQVQVGKVGTMTFTSPTVSTGVLTYSVYGLNVTKNVHRQTLVADDYNGSYLGTYIVERTNCANPANNGKSAFLTAFNIMQSGSAMTMSAAITSGASTFSCAFNGNYSQTGRLGRFSANYTCSTGEVGTLDMQELTRERQGIMGRGNGTNNFGCTLRGTIAAVD
jgi:hypothetical protein